MSHFLGAATGACNRWMSRLSGVPVRGGTALRITSMAAVLLALALPFLPVHVQAQPIAGGQPIRLVVPTAAGGTVDALARLIAQKMSEELGQSMVIENKPGASGIIASEAVARAKADGSVLLIGSVQTHGINPTLHKQLPYDARKSFAPIGLLANTENALMVNPQSPYKTLKDLVEAARTTSGGVTMGTGGNGTSGHLSGVRLEMMAKAQFVHVPYKGGALAVNDLMGGQIDLVFDSLPSALPMIKAGRLRALAIPSQKRSASLPDVPTFIESGYPGFESYGWCTLYAPAGTDPAVIERLNTAMNRALNDPEVRRKLTEMEFLVVGGTSQQAADYTDSEIRKWADLIQAAGVSVN